MVQVSLLLVRRLLQSSVGVQLSAGVLDHPNEQENPMEGGIHSGWGQGTDFGYKNLAGVHRSFGGSDITALKLTFDLITFQTHF